MIFCLHYSIINVPSMKRGSVSNNRLRSALVWAKNQLEKFEKIAFKHRCTYEVSLFLNLGVFFRKTPK